jgi:hypothetical protein
MPAVSQFRFIFPKQIQRGGTFPASSHAPSSDNKSKNDIYVYQRHRVKNARLANHVAQADGKYGVLFRRTKEII